MPRPTKEFLDYFPMYCRGDERTDLLKAKKGMTGFGIYISLLIKLYGEKGYYLNWNENICCIFAANVGVSEQELVETITLLTDVGLFDRDIFEKYGVLTSKEIQENYLFAITKRKNKELDKRYNLVSAEETQVYGEETPDCVEQTPVCVTESTQIKEKKIKENKIIEKESRGEVSPPASNREVSPACDTPTPTPRGEMGNVILTEEEYSRLKAKYPEADPLIERFSIYLASTAKRYASHYATLVRWAEDDRRRQNAPAAQTSAYSGQSYTRGGTVYPYGTPSKTKAASPKRESSFDIDEFYRLACSGDLRSCLT